RCVPSATTGGSSTGRYWRARPTLPRRCRLWRTVCSTATGPRSPPISLPMELLELDPVGDQAVDAEAALLVLLVGLEVALEPFDVAVALEGEDVGGEAVQEPAVVADHHGA